MKKLVDTSLRIFNNKIKDLLNLNSDLRKFDLIELLVQQYENLKKIHVFYAGPTPIAFIIGNTINSTIHPQFSLYNYHTKDNPKYSKAFGLN